MAQNEPQVSALQYMSLFSVILQQTLERTFLLLSVKSNFLTNDQTNREHLVQVSTDRQWVLVEPQPTVWTDTRHSSWQSFLPQFSSSCPGILAIHCGFKEDWTFTPLNEVLSQAITPGSCNCIVITKLRIYICPVNDVMFVEATC